MTFVRFTISRLRGTSDSTLGDRYNIHIQNPAVMSKYDWLPPLQQDSKRRAYSSHSLTGRSREAAHWLKYVTRELWMNKPLLRQSRLGRFRVSNDSAPASRYVCESDVCKTNGVDRANWEQQYKRRVHNRCTAGRACSCECAINRALSDLEINIDIADSSTPDSASGSPVVTSTQNSSWIGSVLSPEITSTILLLDSWFHSTHVHVLTQAQRRNKDVLIVLNAI